MRNVALPVLLLLLISSLFLASAGAQSTYYLALGDSLAIGIQPSLHGDVPTNQGYTDDLYRVFRAHIPGLRFVKLGCSGETTTTMLQGGSCSYSTGSQLAQAVAFIETHRVSFITLDIGANDIDHCISISGIDAGCVQVASATLATNLPKILAALRAAGGSTPIVAMNYYDPFLAAWTLVRPGKRWLNPRFRRLMLLINCWREFMGRFLFRSPTLHRRSRSITSRSSHSSIFL